jgi:hypothetical protein
MADERAADGLAQGAAATLDHRYEHDIPDWADRWLAAVERNRLQRRQRYRERRSFSSTAASSI